MNMINLLYLDLFCGGGGTSTGVERAMVNGQKCAKVVACVNHDANAIASHAANHPHAVHFTEDIRTVSIEKIAEHLKKNQALFPDAKFVMWASLECTNFSRAKGGLSRDADSRTLADSLFRYIDVLSPDYIQIENVVEFLDWGPIVPKVVVVDGAQSCLVEYKNGLAVPVMVPDKARLKEYFNIWVSKMEAYGYRWEYRVLNSANFGAVQSRERLFIQFAKKGLPIAWPQPTHSKDGVNLPKWRAVRGVLNLEDHGQSIFTRKKPLAEKTLERIFAGLVKFVAGGKRAFISKYFSGNPESKNISIDGPTGAITCRDHHALVNVHFLSAYYGNGENVSSMSQPSPTITTHDRLALVNAHFFDMQYGNGTPVSIGQPAPTVTTNPKHSLITCKQWLLNPQYFNPGGSIDDPCFTLIARMDKAPPYLVAAEGGKVAIQIYPADSPCTVRIKQFMAMYGISDISLRMLNLEELKMIMGFPRNYTLVGRVEDKKRFIGNAVVVEQAMSIAQATASAIFKLKIKHAEYAA